jgi:hypothetical protein
MKTLKRSCVLAVALSALLGATGCETDADVASRNISVAAGNFAVDRRIVFYNGITGGYILTIEGKCQVDHAEKMAVTCKTGEGQYKKHYLGLSDNVTYFSEQLDSVGVSVYRHKIVFKPETIIPDVDLRTSVTQ